MENKIEVLAKANIRDKDLVELGFPKITTSYIFYWQRETSRRASRVVRNFYNALYTLKKLYEKYTSKKLELGGGGYTVYLDGKKTFSFYNYRCNFYNPQNLQRLKDIVQELIPLAGGFENLKKEFAKTYAEEKAKFELKDIEIYNWGARLPTGDQQEEYENEKKKFIEALKSDNEFAEKQVYRILKSVVFGANYFLGKSELKLKDILNGTIASIRIYQNLLIFQKTRNTYAVQLSEAERQKVLNIFTLLKL